jgi:hypothetical protein
MTLEQRNVQCKAAEQNVEELQTLSQSMGDLLDCDERSTYPSCQHRIIVHNKSSFAGSQFPGQPQEDAKCRQSHEHDCDLDDHALEHIASR